MAIFSLFTLFIKITNSFWIEGAGEIVATDTQYPIDMTSFSTHRKTVFNGKELVIIQLVEESLV